MAAPATIDELLDLIRRSGLMDAARLDEFLARPEIAELPRDRPRKLARRLVRAGLLTAFQAEQLLLGKWHGFNLGKYRLLERLPTDELGGSFLCEDAESRERVSLHLLPDSAGELGGVARFYREARIAAGLNHPHILGRHDIERDGQVHFVVRPYVDGSSLERIVRKHGPLDVTRAAHYIRQAALGLQHIHEVGLVHRDFRPENLLLDRQGTIKILNLGLAPFYHDQPQAAGAKREPGPIADYLAPEQAIPGSTVDIRTDIHGLGATFYYLLTGRPPCGLAGSRDLLVCLLAQPEPVRTLRPEVPEKLAAVVEKMLAKDPAQRYQLPSEVIEALMPWIQKPIDPPPAEEMPLLSPAVQAAAPQEAGVAPPPVSPPEPEPPLPQRPADLLQRWAETIPTIDDESEPPPPAEAEADGPTVDSETEFSFEEYPDEASDAPPETSAFLEPETQAELSAEEPRAGPALAAPAEPAGKPNGRPPARRAAPSAAPVIPPSLQSRTGSASRTPPARRPSAAPAPRRRLWLLLLAVAIVLPVGIGLALLARSWLAGPSPSAPAQPAEQKERRLEGALDGINGNLVLGWAWDQDQPFSPISVDIYDDQTLLDTVPAAFLRQDLRDRGKGDGRHVFGYKLPASLKDGKERTIHVRFAGTDVELAGSPQKITLKSP